jgi:hypothetical protein
VDDDLMKLMGWLAVDPDDHSLRTGLTEPYTRETLRQRAHLDRGLNALVQEAIDDILPDKLWTPGSWDAKPVATPAATAPGSFRRNEFVVWMESFDDVVKDDTCSGWGSFYGTFQSINQELLNRMFNPGRKVSAAPEADDEPFDDGFTATGPRDDLPTHLAHYGLKPGTPEGDEETKLWVDREQMMRARYGEIDRASRAMVRDARLQRYAQSEADALIEDMLNL